MKASILLAALLAAAVRGDQITTQACVARGDAIVVEFENSIQDEGDWIGLIRSNALTNSDGVPDPNGDDWAWTCGSQSCGSSPATGSISIASPSFSGSGTQNWIAVLARYDNNPAPYVLVAKSATFQVKDSCQTIPVSRIRNDDDKCLLGSL